jgi:hypothetical protein
VFPDTTILYYNISPLITKYYSGDQINKNEMAGPCSKYGEERGAYRILVGRPERRKPLRRPRRRLEDNIIMDLQEVRCGVMDWSDMARDRDRWRAVVSAVMDLRVS